MVREIRPVEHTQHAGMEPMVGDVEGWKDIVHLLTVISVGIGSLLQESQVLLIQIQTIFLFPSFSLSLTLSHIFH